MVDPIFQCDTWFDIPNKEHKVLLQAIRDVIQVEINFSVQWRPDRRRALHRMLPYLVRHALLVSNVEKFKSTLEDANKKAVIDLWRIWQYSLFEQAETSTSFLEELERERNLQEKEQEQQLKQLKNKVKQSKKELKSFERAGYDSTS
jgi:hypothetical protein